VDDFTVETTGQGPQPAQAPAEPSLPLEDAPSDVPDLTADAPEEPPVPAAASQEPEAEKVRQKETYGSKIGRLKAEKEAAERRAAELEAQVASQQYQQPAPPAPVPYVDPADPEPVLDGYLNEPDPYLALTKATARWSARQEQKAFYAQLESQQRVASWQSRVVAAKADLPDYDQVMQQGRALAVTPEMERAILDSDIGPRVSYHLIRHPEEYRQIVGLRGTALAKAFGKLEARLETVPGQVQTPPVHHPKPAPITPVQSSSGRAAESSPDDLEFGPEYVRAMNAKDRERGRLR
jgi:hypothetical protein